MVRRCRFRRGDLIFPCSPLGASRLADRVERLKHPVYRHRLTQIAADAVLLAAAYYLAFRLRFLDAPGGIPARYDHMLANSIGFVVVGQLIVFYAFRLYEKWWRYFRLPDMIAVLRSNTIHDWTDHFLKALGRPHEARENSKPLLDSIAALTPRPPAAAPPQRVPALTIN